MNKALDQRVTKIETETHIQFKELFYRLKRLEMWLICGIGGCPCHAYRRVITN